MGSSIHLSPAERWREIAASPEAGIDLAEAALVIAAEEYRDRAGIYLDLECFRAALADLRHYLLLRPEADDAHTVRRKAAELEPLAARLN